MTKYYVDSNGVYLGGFEGNTGIDFSTFTEVPMAPSDATWIWNGEEFVTPVVPLAELKTRRYNEIDYRTGYLIANGFTYDSKQFSLSINAQANWNALHDNVSEFTWPQEITVINNDVYSLTEANLNAFWTAGKETLSTHLGSGRTLKKAIFDAADKAAVDAIIDNR